MTERQTSPITSAGGDAQQRAERAIAIGRSTPSGLRVVFPHRAAVAPVPLRYNVRGGRVAASGWGRTMAAPNTTTVRDAAGRIEGRVTAVIRLDDLGDAVPLARALHAGGVATLEFTYTNRAAGRAIEEVRAALGEAVCVGAGSVLDAETARAAILAGAQFVVTPTLRPATIALCRRYATPIVCGALTPTELLTAWEAGADFVKVFPASVGGPAYIKDVLAPLPQLKLIPTGGVMLENAADFIAAGAVGVAVGGDLVRREAVARGDWDGLTARARRFSEAVAAARNGGAGA